MVHAGEPQCVWDIGAPLGEGPVWVGSHLWFVDIKSRQIHCFEPASGTRRSWPTPEQVGFVFPDSQGTMVAGLQPGLFRFRPETGDFQPICDVEPDRPANRINDGCVDPAGRLWFGTMDDGERLASGAFYRFDREGLTPTGIADVCVTNGPAVSPDGRTLYWVDSMGGRIWRCDLSDAGIAGPSKLFAAIDPAEGFPDGPTVDSEGCLWIGLYAGWEARRYAPDGRLVDRVRFPVENITKIALGGPDLRTAYATTAGQGLDAQARAGQPLAGGLFAFDVDVPGIACPVIAA